jgi:hypothetical protein
MGIGTASRDHALQFGCNEPESVKNFDQSIDPFRCIEAADVRHHGISAT